MYGSFELWRVLAGIAIFLLAMNFMEEGLQKLSGRPFKLFLKRHTSNRFKAVAGGALVTGILQSSSVVNLLMLAFVGAGIIKMQNALAVMLGANLGTTLSSWIIATVGFKLNIESIALAVTGIAGILVVLVSRQSSWYVRSKLFLGLGLLFTGLGYIKTGIGEMVKQVDLGYFVQYPVIVFLLLGLLITSLIQSSSATMAIVLSALYVHGISLYAATAIVLGSEIGTSLKLVLASVKGSAVKKRVAAGNVLFNLVTTLLVFVFLKQVNYFITTTIGIKDNLTALVFFQTLVNISCILLFFPFLDMFGRLLEKSFKTENETSFIHKVNITDTDLAMEALEREINHFIFYVSQLAFTAFEKAVPALYNTTSNKDFESKSVMTKYEYIKKLYGGINEYCVQLRSGLSTRESTERLEQLVAASRNAMYAAKSLKDAFPDIEQLRNSSNNIKYDLYISTGSQVADFYTRLLNIFIAGKASDHLEKLAGLYASIQEEYKQSLQELYKKAGTRQLSEIEFSTVMNFNREMYTSFKSAVFASKDYLLDGKKADYFDELPGFIR